MSIIAWIVLGLIAGFIASKLVNKTGEGLILDIMLGIVGAVVGGFVFNQLGAAGVTGFNLYSMLVAVIGAVLVLVIYHSGDRATRGRLNLRSPNRKLRAGFAAGSSFPVEAAYRARRCGAGPSHRPCRPAWRRQPCPTPTIRRSLS